MNAEINLTGTWNVTILAWWGFLLKGNVKVIDGNEGYNKMWWGKWGEFYITEPVSDLKRYFIYRKLPITDIIHIISDDKLTGEFYFRGKKRMHFTMERKK